MTDARDLAQRARYAVDEVAAWIEDPDGATRPGRQAVAEAVRSTAELLAADAPGQTVEVRVPPFVAVQCVEGPIHRRGTPPNVVQLTPITWLQVCCGLVQLGDSDAELSGTRATEIARFLPLLRIG